jgi:hypothetical protein
VQSRGQGGGVVLSCVNRVEKHNGCSDRVVDAHSPSVKHKVSCVCGRCLHSREPLSISAKQTHGPIASSAVHPQHPGPSRCARCLPWSRHVGVPKRTRCLTHSSVIIPHQI